MFASDLQGTSTNDSGDATTIALVDCNNNLFHSENLPSELTETNIQHNEQNAAVSNEINEEDGTVIKTSRKRKRNEVMWKTVIRKMKRNHL